MKGDKKDLKGLPEYFMKQAMASNADGSVLERSIRTIRKKEWGYLECLTGPWESDAHVKQVTENKARK